MTSNRNILANFERLFKPTPGHSFTLLVVKDKFNKTYNFYLEDVAGATYSRGLGSINFDKLDDYKDTLQQLLDSKLKVEYRGF